jgi:hypothetical protein
VPLSVFPRHFDLWIDFDARIHMSLDPPLSVFILQNVSTPMSKKKNPHAGGSFDDFPADEAVAVKKAVLVPAIEEEDDFPPLSKKELRILKERAAEMDDPTRFVIVSAFSRRFCLYYVPADGVFAMNDLPPGSLFKCRDEAKAVAKVLGRRGKRKPRRDLQVIAVRKTPRGVRFLEEVKDFWKPNKSWKPILKRKD